MAPKTILLFHPGWFTPSSAMPHCAKADQAAASTIPVDLAKCPKGPAGEHSEKGMERQKMSLDDDLRKGVTHYFGPETGYILDFGSIYPLKPPRNDLARRLRFLVMSVEQEGSGADAGAQSDHNQVWEDRL
jgi:hypothetical protein